MTRIPVSTGLSAHINRFRIAISEEIQALRVNQNRMIPLTDGYRLGRRGGQYLYSFTTDTEVLFPDDTEVRLRHRGKDHDGTLISIDDSNIIISLDSNIGDKVPSVQMYAEPWFLLSELMERLSGIIDSQQANHELAISLLSSRTASIPTNQETFEDYSTGISERQGESPTYNSFQANAIDHVLQHPVTFVWGPPGTGKTSTLGLAVASLIYSGQSVLVVAHSNTAVDTAMRSVARYLTQSSYYKESLLLRFGISPSNIYKDYPMLSVRGAARINNPELMNRINSLESERRELIRNSRTFNKNPDRLQQIRDRIVAIQDELKPCRDELKNLESSLITRAMVVGCTLSKASIAREIYQRQFDAVIVDEASMAFIPHCAYVAALARKRVAIFGDFRQLPPVSQSQGETAKDILQRDIFDYSGVTESVNRSRQDDRLVMLRTQYRMHPSISRIPNDLFYGQLLQDGEGVLARTQPIVEAEPHPGNPLVIYDLSQALAFCFRYERSSRFNPVSALIAADITYRAQIADSSQQSEDSEQPSIGLITPFNPQARLLTRILRETGQSNIRAATVHRFQGSEQNLIVFDAVSNFPMKTASKLLTGGKNSTAARLANVAISRAQGKFIGIISLDFVAQKQDSFQIFKQFVHLIRRNAEIRPISFDNRQESDLPPFTFVLPNITTYDSPQSATSAISDDLNQAGQSINIYWPTRLNSEQHFTLRNNNYDVRLYVRGPCASEIAGNVKNREVGPADLIGASGVVGVDRKVLWLYTNPDIQSTVIRIALPSTVDLLYDFFGITGSIRPSRGQASNHPLGECSNPNCNQPLWPRLLHGRRYQVSCSAYPDHPDHTNRRLNRDDATRMAAFSSIFCPRCQSSMVGASNGNDGSIFLRCSDRNCGGTRVLSDFL